MELIDVKNKLSIIENKIGGNELLNSRFVHGLGVGIGQSAPELIKTLNNIYGKEKTENMIYDFIESISGKRVRKYKIINVEHKHLPDL